MTSKPSNIKRLIKEYQDIVKKAPENYSAGPIKKPRKTVSKNDIDDALSKKSEDINIDDYDFYRWQAIIIGPVGTPYEGGTFHIDIKISKEYPFKPPKVKLTTRILHPNIDQSGDICLDILKDKWSPALSINTMLISLCSLFDQPNSDDPLDPAAADLYIRNRAEFNRKAREYTMRYANR